MVTRFEVYLVNLDAEVSNDPKNTRPAAIVSPDEMNRHLSTILIAPISSTELLYPTRIPIDFLDAKRAVILDQIRPVEKTRLVKKVGEIELADRGLIVEKLGEMFAE
jgi:mRNA interferase MazF